MCDLYNERENKLEWKEFVYFFISFVLNNFDVTLPGYSVRAYRNVDLKEEQLTNQTKQAKKYISR